MLLVTGASGTVGANVVPEPSEKGARFCAGVHSRPLDMEGAGSRTIGYDRPEMVGLGLERVRTVYPGVDTRAGARERNGRSRSRRGRRAHRQAVRLESGRPLPIRKP